jgi:hypothetical protein
MARYFIERTPNLLTGTIYEVYSEDRSLILKITRESSAAGCQLNYCDAKDFLTAYVPLNSLDFTFHDAVGRVGGYARQAGFSILGRSIVEDEKHSVVGFVKYGFRPRMKLFSSNGEPIAIIDRDRTRKVPFFLWPSQAHLARRYVLETASETSLDHRLFFCVVCLLVAEEWQSSAS